MDAPPPLSPPPPPPALAGPPGRHGCLLTWLILMLVGDALTIIVRLAMPFIESAIANIQSAGDSLALPHQPGWAGGSMFILAVFDIVCVISIFRWKKWAFYGSVAASLLLLVINLAIGTGILNSLLYLVSPALLYAALQIGGAHSGWKQLK